MDLDEALLGLDNGTMKKYENKEKHQIYVETLVGKKTTGRGKSFTMSLRGITKCDL